MLKKPGYSGDPKDLRPIAVTNTILRIIQRTITYKISYSVAARITFHQKGFLNFRYIGECIKNVYDHVSQLHKGWALVDFEKAYDSVNRKGLTQVMKRMKFPTEFITLVSTMLKPSKAYLLDSDYHLRISRGVPQGSPLSCILFLLAIEPLLRSITQDFPGIVMEAYADDIALISRQDKLLPKIQKHIELNAPLIGLKVNEKKSCVMPLAEHQDSITLPQHWKSPIVHEFKYLGIIISKELSEKQVYAATVAKFRLRLETAKAYGGPLYWRILYHKIFAISVFSHLVQFMLPSTSLCNSVDTLSHSFLDPMKTMSKEVLFAMPGTYLPPPFPVTLAEYVCLFPNECLLEGCWQDLRIYDQATARFKSNLSQDHRNRPIDSNPSPQPL